MARQYAVEKAVGEAAQSGQRATRLEGAGPLQEFELHRDARTAAEDLLQGPRPQHRRFDDVFHQRVAQGANLFNAGAGVSHFLCKIRMRVYNTCAV